MDRDLDALLDLLVDHAMVPLSGTKVARELGIPHSTLKERVERLREFGVRVAGYRGRGFRLEAVPDILTARNIQLAARGTQFGGRVYHFYTVGSTMDVATRLAQQGEEHGAIVLADEQTAGRGRLGRTWQSERGAGLYFSLLLRPRLIAARAPVLTLAAGLGVLDAVRELTGVVADLKWPNDVLLNGRKCCGILPEMTAEGDRVKHIVIGIGLNVNQRKFPDELRREATSLAMEAGRSYSRYEVLAAVLRGLERRYDQFIRDGAPAIIGEFEAWSSYARGRRVTVETEAGTFSGITEGLDSCGFLQVRREDTGAVEPVLAGTIRPA